MSRPITIGRRIGFDYGEKRIGVATSDSESILVSPHATILNDAQLEVKITEILEDVRPIYVVVEIPNIYLVLRVINQGQQWLLHYRSGRNIPALFI